MYPNLVQYSVWLWVDLLLKLHEVYFLISWSPVCGPSSSENLKKNFKMAMLAVIIFGGIPGWLESQGREDLEKRKETHPNWVHIMSVSGMGRSVFRAKTYFYFCGSSILD